MLKLSLYKIKSRTGREIFCKIALKTDKRIFEEYYKSSKFRKFMNFHDLACSLIPKHSKSIFYSFETKPQESFM